jgi:translation initiation factor 4G
MSASISHAPNPTIAASSPAAPAHSSAGSSADVAAAPAGGPAHHGHASVSPVNGGGAIKPSMPTIVSSNGTAPIDHARKSSVHIKQMPPATGPPAIKFGALSSPAPAHSNLNVQAQNPRVASPAHSPSPIPHNPLSGGKPTDLPTRPNLVFGGQQGPDGAEANRGPNMPPHARRESSQSAHGSFSGRPGPHYSHPTYSPQPRTVMPNQHLGPRGVAPTFQPQANSPFRQNRSPAITPASLHQQQQFANPQGMPFYQPGPYPQQVCILSSMSNPTPAVEYCKSASPATASRIAQLWRYPAPFPSSNREYAQPLTTHPNQGMYNVPPQDAYNPYYTQNFTGLQQSMHYPGPGSPGRGHHGYPQQMQAQYGHAAYGPPQAQSMSRTPSNMSQPSIPQPSTPAMTNVNHITHTPSITSASPAPSSAAFERPKKQSKAIIIKNGKHTFPQRAVKC